MGMKRLGKLILSVALVLLCSIINGGLFQCMYNMGIRIPLADIYNFPEISTYAFICMSLLYAQFFNKSKEICDISDSKLYINILNSIFSKSLIVILLVILYLIFA